ncbi:MAG: hypothetical protein A2Y64_02615 [Candidatus Coatesbacteria bacterium RBG_13_66_14]|uniref:YvlB/LiaX N-terminal domain-containing protein n=1 Tax=Candidatus Coatesbacteria bacterium RBG_13_66_14 TaxID=1817816 RepID=A0A1F5F799_9BACT|nr:MAG: hypothetical protein A2Y64_02615 [Candidatus Coatesbacteria bacterium RBG_13_66_14]
MTAEERKKILEMVADGTVTTEEAERLFTAAGSDDDAPTSARADNKFLIIKVHQGDKTNVNVRLPLALARLAKMFIPKDVEVNGKPLNVDMDQIINLVESEVEGNIVEVHQVDDDSGEITDVEIYLE